MQLGLQCHQCIKARCAQDQEQPITWTTYYPNCSLHLSITFWGNCFWMAVGQMIMGSFSSCASVTLFLYNTARWDSRGACVTVTWVDVTNSGFCLLGKLNLLWWCIVKGKCNTACSFTGSAVHSYVKQSECSPPIGKSDAVKSFFMPVTSGIVFIWGISVWASAHQSVPWLLCLLFILGLMSEHRILANTHLILPASPYLTDSQQNHVILCEMDGILCSVLTCMSR